MTRTRGRHDLAVDGHGDTDGPCIITNGTFDSADNWAGDDVEWSIGSGVASCDGTQSSNTLLSQIPAASVVTGRRYLVCFEVTAISAGNVRALVGGTSGGIWRSATGKYREVLISSGFANVYIQGDADFVGSVDNFCTREIY